MSSEKSDLHGEDASSNIKTGQLAKMITEIGPNISEIARQLGQFKESVRYRYKEKLLNKGFAVHVAVDHEKLGLRRVILLVEFAESYKALAHKMFNLLSQDGYLVSYAKVLPDGRYLVHASVPEEFLESYKELFSSLQRLGLLRSFEFNTFQWFRNPPMKTTLYDFDEGAWDFDWATEAKVDKKAAMLVPSTKEKFDMVDLQILAQLQIDGNRTLSEMSGKLGVNYKTLTWHYRKHIQQRHLAKGYVIKWMGTTYDAKAGRAAHKKHTYLYVAVLFSELDQARRLEVMARLNQLPFIWSEAAGDWYEAELVFPIEALTEGLQYIAEVISDTNSTARYFITDQANSMAFSIEPKLYSEAKEGWVFNLEKLTRSCRELVPEIRGARPDAVPFEGKKPPSA